MKLINLGSHTLQEVNNFRFRPTRIDHLLELAAFLPVLANWIYILYRYREAGGDLPSELYASGVTALIIFLLLEVTGYCPLRYINFPFRVRPHKSAFSLCLAFHLPSLGIHRQGGEPRTAYTGSHWLYGAGVAASLKGLPLSAESRRKSFRSR